MIQVAHLIRPMTRVRGVFYGWWLVGLASVVMAVCVVPFFYALPVWFVALESRFAWSRFQVSLALSLTRVEGSIVGPIGGYLIDRLGSRRMTFIGMVIVGVGFLLLSRIQELWQFYGAFMVISIGTGLGTWLAMMTIVNHWFVRRRSLAMSMVTVGFHIGAVSLVPLIAWAVGSVDAEESSGFGWRATAAGTGVFIIVVAMLIYWLRLIRDRPESYGMRPEGAAEPSSESPDGLGEASRAPDPDREFTWREAMRTGAFWLISFGHAGTSIVIVTIMVHLGPLMRDQGHSLQMVAWVISTYTAIGIVFTLLGGYIGDRAPMRVALFWFSMFQPVAIVVVLFSGGSLPLVFLFAFLLGVGNGRAGLSSSVRGLYFGRKAFASITGMSMVPMNVLMLVLPPFAGYMFDSTGSYVVPFSLVAALSVIGAFCYLALPDHRAVRVSPRPPAHGAGLEAASLD